MQEKELLSLTLQYAKFGSIGIVATAIHVAVFTALVEVYDTPPLLANILAFCIAALFAFVGHLHWTFKLKAEQRLISIRQLKWVFVRFFLIALLGLGLNSFSVFVVVDVVGLSYLCAIPLMVFVVPPIVFLISKYWTFRFY